MSVAMTRGKSDPLLDLCRSLPGATEDVKWGNDLVFSVGGKMFAAFEMPEGESIGLKVASDVFEALVQQPGIIPAPYLARASWVKLDGRGVLPREMLEDLLRQAHALVAAKLPKKVRLSLGLG
jgi:predicted DNA-binding protein (MmcQ/YjbR family)